MLNPGQTNTRKGEINLPASVNLTGCENLLWKIVNNNGVANFALPTSVNDIAPFIGASGDVIGANTSAEAPSMNENARIFNKLLRISALDREAATRIGNAIDRAIKKWRSIQSTLEKKG